MEDEIYKKCVSVEDIYDIIDGEASKELCDLFAEHIKTCEKCRHEYENIKKLETALKNMTAEPSADFAKNTMARLKTVKRNPILRITGHPAFKSVTAVAACLLIVVIVCSKGIFGTANEILDEQDFNDALLIVSTDEPDTISAEDVSTYSQFTDSDKEENTYDIKKDIGTDDIPEYVSHEDPSSAYPSSNGFAPTESNDSSVGHHAVNEPIPDSDDTDSVSTGEFVPPMLPSMPNNATPDSVTAEEPNSSKDATEQNAPTSTQNKPIVENPMASDAGPGMSIEPPTASDAFAADPETLEYTYIPTVLVDEVTVTDAIYAHETTIVSTENDITFYIYEGECAISEYDYMLMECTDRSADYERIEEEPIPAEPIEVAPGELIPVIPVMPEGYGKPTVMELANGIYANIPKENDHKTTIYWYENGCFYRLLLPIEYLDGNESRFKDLTLIKNPSY